MFTRAILGSKATLLATFLASAIVSAGAQTAGSTPQSAPAKSPLAPSAKSTRPVKPYRYRTAQVPKSAQEYYQLLWGVDSLSVKSMESGELIRFSYRILDPAKAKVLNDKKSEPSLVDPQAGVSLVIPSMEKVGKLRQSSTPEAGKVYWMAFSNKGRKVKPGHRVSIVIGTFRADSLAVQ
jgi:hypothetical protein